MKCMFEFQEIGFELCVVNIKTHSHSVFKMSPQFNFSYSFRVNYSLQTLAF